MVDVRAAVPGRPHEVADLHIFCSSGVRIGPLVRLDRDDRSATVCTQNADRSQPAAELMSRHSGGLVQCTEGGRFPGRGPPPERWGRPGRTRDTVRGRVSQAGDRRRAARGRRGGHDGCSNPCPLDSGKRYLDWDLAHPAGAALDKVRRIADEDRPEVLPLLGELGVRPAEKGTFA